MQHEDGYCDGCGCEVTEAQLTVHGLELCAECAQLPEPAAPSESVAPGAYGHD